MKERFFIKRSGKTFVLYAGLVDEAHERGLSEIRTELIQAPSAENGDVAIAKAAVTLASADEVPERTFEGIGDASPRNVSKNIAPHLIRMAETRAKARALRDAVNVEVTSLEELASQEDAEGESAAPESLPEEQGRSAKHEDLLESIGSMFNAIHSDGQPDKRTVWEAAKESEERAEKVLTRLRKLAEQHPLDQPDEIEEDPDEDEPYETGGKANPEQVARLTELANGLYGDQDITKDGHEWLQREKGKPFSEMSLAEAMELIAALEAEKGTA